MKYILILITIILLSGILSLSAQPVNPDEGFFHTPETHPEFETLSATQPDTTGKHRLIEIARERGWVMIMVTWKLEGYEREGHLGQGQRHAQRGDIQQLQQQRLEELEAKELNIIIQRNMQVIPVTSMVVDKETLLYLFNSSGVKRITQNRYRRNQ